MAPSDGVHSRLAAPAWSLALASILALWLGGAQPASGDGYPAYPPLSGKADKFEKIAKEYEQQIARRGMRYDDPALQALVDRVAKQVLPVVADSFIDFRVRLVRDPSPRAFSLADGQIYLHTGLLARLQDEAQLAAVLAHEAHHVAAHHHIETDRDRRTNANMTGTVVMLLNSTTGAGESYDSDYLHVAQSVFSETMEFEADAASVSMISQAGYAPAAAAEALALLRQDPELSTDRQAAMYDTPGLLAERQGRLQRLASEPAPPADRQLVGPRPFLLRQVLDMTIDDYLRLDRPGAALKLADAALAVQPDASLYAARGDAHLALGPRPVDLRQDFVVWEIDGKRAEKTREEINAKYLATEGGPERLAHNLESAKTSYRLAIQADESCARAYRGLGDLHYQQHDYREAGRNYLRYLSLEGDSLDRPFVVERLRHIKSELVRQKDAEP